jgi:hypothetical protein
MVIVTKPARTKHLCGPDRTGAPQGVDDPERPVNAAMLLDVNVLSRDCCVSLFVAAFDVRHCVGKLCR